MPSQVMISAPPAENVLRMIGDRCSVSIWPENGVSDEELSEIEGFYTYGHMKVAGVLMDRMPMLKVISAFGVGVDHIDLEGASERGIPVGNTPNIVSGATADMTFALLLGIARNLLVGDQYARSTAFTSYDLNILHGYDVFGSTIGIVGMGKIGSEVARRAQAFGMRVLYHNRTRYVEAESETGAMYRDLDSLLRESDFVTLNCPLTPETRHLMGPKQFALMQKSAFLINVARGGVVDHDALLYALESDEIAGAAIDVTEPEPLPRHHPILTAPNLIITPHLGTATKQTRERMAQLSVDNLLAGLAGDPLPSQVLSG